jgi:hypothetical protein
MRRELPTLLLFLVLSLTAAADAVPSEESMPDKLSQNLTDDTAGTVTDQSTPIFARGTSNFSGAAIPQTTVTTRAYPSGNCGLLVFGPHASQTTSAQIHTRIESFCNQYPLVANTVRGKTYRSRGYGWERVGREKSATATLPSSRVQRLRLTVPVDCQVGDWYRYRTEGFGTISTGVQSFSAAAYEQNDDEIQCVRR